MKHPSIFIVVFMILVILSIFLSTIPAVQAEFFYNPPSLDGFQIFPSDYIWNVPIDTMPVDASSADYINTMGFDDHVHLLFGSAFPGMPYNVVDSTQAKQYVSFEYPKLADNVPYPIPDNPLMENTDDPDSCTGDCHMLILDRDTNFLYELWAAERQPDGTWTAGHGAAFDLSDYSLKSTGADASFMPMLPGLLRYDEVASGSITHALRFATPETRYDYIWPARSIGSLDPNPARPPFGQRFRLKESFDTSGYGSQAKVILEGLKKYGMILSDNAMPTDRWIISGAGDSRWDQAQLDSLANIHGSDFEAIDESSLMIDEDSGQARVTPIVTPTPTPVANN